MSAGERDLSCSWPMPSNFLNKIEGKFVVRNIDWGGKFEGEGDQRQAGEIVGSEEWRPQVYTGSSPQGGLMFSSSANVTNVAADKTGALI